MRRQPDARRAATRHAIANPRRETRHLQHPAPPQITALSAVHGVLIDADLTPALAALARHPCRLRHARKRFLGDVETGGSRLRVCTPLPTPRMRTQFSRLGYRGGAPAPG